MRKILYIIAILLLNSIELKSQVINIENYLKDISNNILKIDSSNIKKGILSNTINMIDVSINATKNNRDLLIVKLGHRSYLPMGKYIFLLINDFAYINGSGVIYNYKWMHHMRVIKKINKYINTEHYFQIQSDLNLNINYRMIGGNGIRLALLNKEKIHLYTGIAIMLEFEDVNSSINNNMSYNYLDIRASNYLNFSYILSNIEKKMNVSINSIIYYQPLPYRIDDYKISTDTELLFMFKRYYFSAGGNVSIDSYSPLGQCYGCNNQRYMNINYNIYNKIGIRF